MCRQLDCMRTHACSLAVIHQVCEGGGTAKGGIEAARAARIQVRGGQSLEEGVAESF
mgnify:CR=1 FL=1